MHKLTPRAIRNLSDFVLEQECKAARKMADSARNNFQSQRRNISDRGWESLHTTMDEAENYWRLCQAEKDRRKAAGKWDPVAKTPHRTIMNHPGSAKPPMSASQRRALESDDDAEGPPIMVWDGGVLRRWRPGDPIY
jgi:hypothetical protein